MRLLIVDDDVELCSLLKEFLEREGYAVQCVHEGHAALDLAQQGGFDLIILDVMLPGLDGFEILKRLRLTGRVPVLMLTARGQDVDRIVGLELGADDYLPKPFTTDALYAAVDARLKKSQTVRDEAERKLASLRNNISLMMPHEMRTPLNGIISNAEILAAIEESPLPPADIAEMGREISQSSQRLERLIENFLIYAQLELVAADPKSVNAMRVGKTEHSAPLVKKNSSAIAAQFKRSGDLNVEAGDFSLPMSEEYFGRVVNELVQNAFKFSQAGSSVSVKLFESFNEIALTIKDAGRGFSTEQISRIGAYEQFDRKIQDQQGMGLGFVIAKRLVELHGGSLSVESVKGIGSTITVKLPKTKTA
jgi:two-component system, sensor histidine kinase and response regulator